MKDIFLLEAIKKNDKKAFKIFFDKYYTPLVGYINTFTKDLYLAEDIAQQSFIIFWTKRKKIKILKSPKSYLYSIAYNSYIDYYRKKKKQDTFFDDLKEKALRDLVEEDEELMQKRLEKLKTIINDLPPRCQQILKMNKFEGFKYSEIAEKLGVSIKTVEVQMGIAFKKIRKGFEDTPFLLFLVRQLA
ncbi:RNA polymerase sigma-70 factor [Postechiella marina]|uniref:RNA polymerase sigma-70 factor n=1 Tax=Postechiella marina TaxID=943941 RepID=A0ABP8C6L3_9FLAO